VKTKELISVIQHNEMISPEQCQEIIEKLRQLETLKEMLNDVWVSFGELFSFSNKIILED